MSMSVDVIEYRNGNEKEAISSRPGFAAAMLTRLVSWPAARA
jgi:hypothetical protein